MSISAICEQIMAKAEAEVKDLYSLSEKQFKQISEDWLAQSAAKIASLEESQTQKSNQAVQKAKNLAHKKGNEEILSLKNQILDQVLSEMLKSLANCPAKDYAQNLSRLMAGIPLTEGLIHPAQGKEHSTKEAIKIAGKNFQLGESRNLQGGFILETSQIDYDFSFENLILSVYRPYLTEFIIKSF